MQSSSDGLFTASPSPYLEIQSSEVRVPSLKAFVFAKINGKRYRSTISKTLRLESVESVKSLLRVAAALWRSRRSEKSMQSSDLSTPPSNAGMNRAET